MVRVPCSCQRARAARTVLRSGLRDAAVLQWDQTLYHVQAWVGEVTVLGPIMYRWHPVLLVPKQNLGRATRAGMAARTAPSSPWASCTAPALERLEAACTDPLARKGGIILGFVNAFGSNFGDLASALFVRLFAGAPELDARDMRQNALNSTPVMLSLGSLIAWANLMRPGDLIWGTGGHNPSEMAYDRTYLQCVSRSRSTAPGSSHPCAALRGCSPRGRWIETALRSQHRTQILASLASTGRSYSDLLRGQGAPHKALYRTPRARTAPLPVLSSNRTMRWTLLAYVP